MVHRTISFAFGKSLLTMPAKADPHRFDDLFAAFGRIELRRMFGGEGIYASGQIIGIVMGDQIFLKTDEATREAFAREGCKPFAYQARGEKRQSHSYYAIPERLYDEPEELADWARAALHVAKAKRTAPKRRKPAR